MGRRRVKGCAPLNSMASTPGIPLGGCVRSNLAAWLSAPLQRAPKAPFTSRAIFAEPAGEVLVVTELSVLSAPQLECPVLRPPMAARCMPRGSLHVALLSPLALWLWARTTLAVFEGVTEPSPAQRALGASGSNR